MGAKLWFSGTIKREIQRPFSSTTTSRVRHDPPCKSPCAEVFFHVSVSNYNLHFNSMKQYPGVLNIDLEKCIFTVFRRAKQTRMDPEAMGYGAGKLLLFI